VLDRDVFSVNGDHVRNFDAARISVGVPRGAVAGDLVLGECSLSFLKICFAETSAALGCAVPNDVDGSANDPALGIAPGWFKPQSGTFASTRHDSLILSILASVV
jgi:hypothetical protein